MLQQRRTGGDAQELAAVLAAASPGRTPCVVQELEAAAAAGVLPPLLLVAGQADAKFVGAAEKLAARLLPGDAPTDYEGDWHLSPLASGDGGGQEADATVSGGGPPAVEVAVLPSCGHAAHIERPAELLTVLQRFFDCCSPVQSE